MFGLLILSLLFSGVAFCDDRSTVNDIYRYWALSDEGGCPKAIVDLSEEGENPQHQTERDAFWELTIDRENRRVGKRMYQLASEEQATNLKLLHEARAKLRVKPQGVDQLQQIFAKADLLDNITHERWEWLRSEHDFLISLMSLAHLSQLPAGADFAPVEVDFIEKRLRVNLMFNMDCWLEAFNAVDVQDPNVVAVQAVADAVYLMKTLKVDDEPQIDDRFVDWAIGIMNNSPKLVARFAEQHRSDGPIYSWLDSWQEELVGQVWTFFRERHRLQEGLRYMAERRRQKDSVYHLVLNNLSSGLPRQNEAKQIQFLTDMYRVDADVVDVLWRESLPAECTSVNQ